MATLSRREFNEKARRTTEQALLAATVALLDEGQPFAEIKIDQIVGRAGFSRQTFYSYFRDKRDVILRLGASLESEVSAAANPWLRDGQGTIRTTIRAVLAAFRANVGTLSAMIEAATYDAEVLDLWRAIHDRFLESATARIAVAAPELDAAHVEARAFALVWMTERALTEYLARPTLDEQALLDEIAGLWEHTLL